jgi:AGZA family xanthine/uracil permease-like MFS transporter
MIALGLILYALVAKIRLPYRAPEVLASVAVGAAVYYLLAAAGLSVHDVTFPTASFPFGLPLPTLGFIEGMPLALTQYLPVALPFAILTVIGGIDVTESARAAGEDYSTRDILLTEAVSTLVAGVCGGVAQTTPYIGHPAYKAMGGRAAYTLATGLVVGLGGIFGVIAFLAGALPMPVLAPILVFIGLEITGQSYLATPRRHVAAVTLAVLPSIAQLVLIFLSQIQNGALLASAIDPVGTMQATGITNPDFIRTCAVMVMLGNGFILTALLWGGGLAFLIDRRIAPAALTFSACAALSFFGFIHSVMPAANIYLPWRTDSLLPWHWAAAYIALAAMIAALGRTRAYRDSPPPAEPAFPG